MIVAGIDVGSLTAKSVLLNGNGILGWSLLRTKPDSSSSAQEALEAALVNAKVRRTDLGYIVATGYGRLVVPFADDAVTEISCHAKGTKILFPEVRTILDMGGQDCKAISVDDKGRITNFTMNDKCAAGTGRYLERIAKALDIPLDEIGERSLRVETEAATISNYCALFAEADVISLLRAGKHPNDILAGACEAIVERIMALMSRVAMVEEFSISGGVAKNRGVVKRLEETYQTRAQIAFEPQIVGALGAAVFAREKMMKH